MGGLNKTALKPRFQVSQNFEPWKFTNHAFGVWFWTFRRSYSHAQTQFSHAYILTLKDLWCGLSKKIDEKMNSEQLDAPEVWFDRVVFVQPTHFRKLWHNGCLSSHGLQNSKHSSRLSCQCKMMLLSTLFLKIAFFQMTLSQWRTALPVTCSYGFVHWDV